MQPDLAWLDTLNGWCAPDTYSTAWLALVPAQGDLCRPAWPAALDYLRAHQLPDGGWGAPRTYYAHERTVSTLAAILALTSWAPEPGDRRRIERGQAALWRYATDLDSEPDEPIGFELLLPRLRDALPDDIRGALPLEAWARFDEMHARKIELIRHLKPAPGHAAAWWFSMEMLPEAQLAGASDDILDAKGSIATSTAATAAYLAARRRAGGDSPRAARYLDRLMRQAGAVPFCWPFDIFENVWVLDSLRRAGISPQQPSVWRLIRQVQASWHMHEPGLSYSDHFPVNDGDDTMVGFAVLNWAGLTPDDAPVLAFWNGDHFRSYMDERHASASANLHALTALRLQPGFPHRALAEIVTAWLRERMSQDGRFDDKWHYSPYYSIAHAVSAFAGWDDEAAACSLSYLLDQQRDDGGWGMFRSTGEETAHCVLALADAQDAGLLPDARPLKDAAKYLRRNAYRPMTERLWIGKTLFYPEGIVQAALTGARITLEARGFNAGLAATRVAQPAQRRISPAPGWK